MTSKNAMSRWAALILGLVFTGDLRAVIIAEDRANDPAYQFGWFVGDDGGTGFLPWGGAGNYGGGPMEIDNGPEPTNNLGAPAFRTGPGFSGFQVARQFDTPLQVGQSFSIDFDTYAIAPGGGDILISFGNEDGIDTQGEQDERISFYAYYYDDGTFQFGSDFWGINAQTANNNLAGGASLPADPLNGIVFQSNYTTTDASDGFTLKLDIVTTDTYRLRVFDDASTKLDISGQLFNQTVGELINNFSVYGSPVTDAVFEQYVYFNNIVIESAAGLTGDFDSDGDVDGRDFLTWQRGGSPTALSASDLAAWQGNYGAPLTAVLAVPEPLTVNLLGISLISSLGLAGRKSIR